MASLFSPTRRARTLLPLAAAALVASAACAPAAPTVSTPTSAPVPPTARPAPTTAPAPAAVPTSAPTRAAAPAATTGLVPTLVPAPTAPAQAAGAKTYVSTKIALRWRNEADPASLRPGRPAGVEGARVQNNIFSSLFRYEPVTNKIIPDLAESYDVTPDGLTWTFHIRKGVQFQKGFGELTAEDVAYSYDWTAHNPMSSAKAGWRYLDQIKVIDPYTIQLVLKQPSASILHQLTNNGTGWIISKKAAEQMGAAFDRAPVGSGPYQFDSWVPNGELTVTAFDGYFRGPASIKKVTWVPILEASTTEVGLGNGELDGAAGVRDPNVLDRLKARSDMTIYELKQKNVAGYQFNCRTAPLDKVEVRQALLMAIDRDSLAKDFFGRYRTPATGPLTPNWVEYTADTMQYPYDPAKAKALLAQAGVPNGFKLTLTMSNSGDSPDLAAVTKTFWDAIGVETTLDIRDRASYAARYDQEVMATQLFPTPPPDPAAALDSYHRSAFTPGGTNLCHYDGVTELMDQADRTLDQNTRTGIYQQIQKKIMQDLPVLPITAQNYQEVMHNYVKGIAMSNTTMAYFYDVWTQ